MSEVSQPSAFGDREIWSAANALVDTHGENAPLYALHCAGLSLEVGNFARAARWRLVWQATQQLMGIDGSDTRLRN